MCKHRFSHVRTYLGLALLLLLGSSLRALAQPNAAHLEQLRTQALQAIELEMANVDGIMGVYAKDLRTGEVLAFNENLVFPQGSSIKIPILFELFRQAHAGQYGLDDSLPVQAADMVGGSGVLQFLGDGSTTMSLRDLGTLMIVLSDNTATNLLIEHVGMDAVNETLSTARLSNTKLQRIMMNSAASGRGEENLSTPAEASAFMEMLYTLDEPWKDEFLRILRHPKSANLGTLLPTSVSLANKPGGITGVTCEWGLVELERGAYTIAVMSNYVVGGGAGDAIARISKIVYDYYWRLSLSTAYGTRVPAALHKP